MQQVRPAWERFQSFLADDGGNASLEFVTLVPPLFYILFSIGEAGALMTRTVSLERGINIAARDVRLGLPTVQDTEDLKQRVCEEAFLDLSCEENLVVEVGPLDDFTDYTSGPVSCVDRTDEDFTPVVTPVQAERGEIMFVRACLVVDPIFPGMGLGAMLPKDASGGYAIILRSAFLNEPE